MREFYYEYIPKINKYRIFEKLFFTQSAAYVDSKEDVHRFVEENDGILKDEDRLISAKKLYDRIDLLDRANIWGDAVFVNDVLQAIYDEISEEGDNYGKV